MNINITRFDFTSWTRNLFGTPTEYFKQDGCTCSTITLVFPLVSFPTTIINLPFEHHYHNQKLKKPRNGNTIPISILPNNNNKSSFRTSIPLSKIEKTKKWKHNSLSFLRRSKRKAMCHASCRRQIKCQNYRSGVQLWYLCSNGMFKHCSLERYYWEDNVTAE